MSKTKPIDEIFNKWKKEPDYVNEYNALEEEFSIAEVRIKARSKLICPRQKPLHIQRSSNIDRIDNIP